ATGRGASVEVACGPVGDGRGGARPDIADHRYFRGRGLIPLREWLAAGEQPLRRHAEAARVFPGLVRTVVAPARRLRALVRAVGRYRNAHRLGGKPRRLVALLARHS